MGLVRIPGQYVPVVTTDVLDAGFTPSIANTSEDTGLSITITTSAGAVVQTCYRLALTMGSANNWATYAILVLDGVQVGPINYVFDAIDTATYRSSLSETRFHTLTAGAHTFKVQLYYATGSAPVEAQQSSFLQVIQF